MSLRPIPVLLYHRIEPVGAETSSATSTPIDLFTAHLEWLADNGFRSLTMEELTARINGAPPIAEREVAITFDDGYTCLDWAAAPVLRSNGFRATAFLITSRVDDDRFITWEQARALADEGVIEFYGHTHSHKRWELGPETFETIVTEIRKSGELLSANLRRPVEHFNYMAWPYGRTCQEWDEAAIEAGVTTQFVVQRGAITHEGRHSRLPRLMADGMPLPLFSRLVNTLSTRPGANAFNLAFGTIRGMRGKGAYI